MVELDTQLLQEARRFCNDANWRHVTQLMIWYKNAIEESRDGVYNVRHEERLRAFVAAEQDHESLTG